MSYYESLTYPGLYIRTDIVVALMKHGDSWMAYLDRNIDKVNSTAIATENGVPIVYEDYTFTYKGIDNNETN